MMGTIGQLTVGKMEIESIQNKNCIYIGFLRCGTES